LADGLMLVFNTLLKIDGLVKRGSADAAR